MSIRTKRTKRTKTHNFVGNGGISKRVIALGAPWCGGKLRQNTDAAQATEESG
jgi:hypothetical protein